MLAGVPKILHIDNIQISIGNKKNVASFLDCKLTRMYYYKKKPG